MGGDPRPDGRAVQGAAAVRAVGLVRPHAGSGFRPTARSLASSAVGRGLFLVPRLCSLPGDSSATRRRRAASCSGVSLGHRLGFRPRAVLEGPKALVATLRHQQREGGHAGLGEVLDGGGAGAAGGSSRPSTPRERRRPAVGQAGSPCHGVEVEGPAASERAWALARRGDRASCPLGEEPGKRPRRPRPEMDHVGVPPWRR